MYCLLVLAVFIHSTWGQGAPGDFDTVRCPLTTPSNEVVLFHSEAYEDLYSNRWLFRSYDGDSDARWISAGGVCTRSLLTNGFTPSSTDDNWAFSQYINYLDAIEVIVSIEYSFFQGNTGPVTVYFRNSNGELMEPQRVDISGYNPANGTVENSRLQLPGMNMGERQWGFPRPASTQGFYLAIREQGAIILSISKIVLYHRVQPSRTDGLLSCPIVPLPARGGMSMGTCSCAANSMAVPGVSLDTTCDYDSVCSGGQWCGCLPGYQLQHNNGCIACPEGTYKSLHDNSSCLTCPTNSESRGTNNTVCPCIPPNIRDPNNPNAPCTTPPSSPRLILGNGGLPIVSGDIATVCWLPALDKGGLNDLRYNIYIFSTDTDNPTYTRLNPAEGVIQQSGDNTMKVCYDAPVSDVGVNYGIIVVSTNGATASIDGDVISNVEDVQGRSVAFFVAGQPASQSQGTTSLAGPVVGTLIVTAVVTAVISVLVTVLVMTFLCKGRLGGGGSSDKGYQTSTNSYKMESKSADPPSQPPPVHKPASFKPASRAPPPPKPSSRPAPPRPAPRHV